MHIALRASAALAAATLLAITAVSPAYAALPTAELVADINATGDSNPNELTAYNGLLYFAADDGSGNELFVSDGSVGSASKLDLNPTGASDPYNFTIFNSKLYFVANDGTNGFELWVVNGNNPPSMVTDLEVGAGSSDPDDLTVFGGKLYFSAQVTGVGNEPFVMTTAEVITLVSDVWAGAPGSNPSDFYAYGGYLYFAASDTVLNIELWRTDGATTTMFADLNPTGFSNPHNFATAGGALYFIASDGLGGPPYNYELWTTNGVAAPTQLTTDLAINNGYQYFTVYNDTLFFSSGNASIGQELGHTTGGAIPTFFDINPGAASSSPQDFTAFNGELWFVGDTGANGWELMHTDGVSAPVLGPEILVGAGSSNAYGLLASGASLYFIGSLDGSDYELWLTNGSAVAQATNIFPGGDADPYALTTLGGELYFAAQSTDGYELWRVQLSTLAVLAATGVDLLGLGGVAGTLVLAGGILLMRRRHQLQG